MPNRYRGVAYQHGRRPCTGILLSNLGTPEAPTTAALRRYLAEFLWDPRVVEIPRFLWWPILHLFILPFRPARSAHAYRKIWLDSGSPLLVYTRRQARQVEQLLQERVPGPVKVAVGMRYGKPSIASALQALRTAGAQRLLSLPLYPQYSGATTASVFDALARALMAERWVPELRTVHHYHDDPAYIAALARSIDEFWQAHGRPQRLLFSFHGMPKRTLLAGDPYFCQCQKTARLTAERLALPAEQWQVVFQSRFGREEWLQPYADRTIAALPGEGCRKIDIVCPGFAADCLETLEEMAMQNRDLFLEAGGEQYRYIPALNDRADHIEALVDLIVRHGQGWPELDDQAAPQDDSDGPWQASAERARALGAQC